jgi:hypothetical protein
MVDYLWVCCSNVVGLKIIIVEGFRITKKFQIKKQHGLKHWNTIYAISNGLYISLKG